MHDESPELFGFDLMFLSSMCDVSRRCSELLLALGCIHPLFAHGCEGVRFGACRALLQLCKYALHTYCMPLACLLHASCINTAFGYLLTLMPHVR
jgi:hypothetical protein